MAEKVIFVHTDEKGREFKIVGNLDNIRKEIIQLQTGSINEAEEDYAEYVYWNGGGDSRPSTEDDRFKEMVDVSVYFDEDFDWTEIFNDLSRKKNGTFAKGRVKKLHRARSFSQEWEDSYGYAAPEVRIKIRGDLEAIVEFTWQVEHW